MSVGIATECDNEKHLSASDWPHGSIEEGVEVPGFYFSKQLKFGKGRLSGGRCVNDRFMRFSFKARRKHAYFNEKILRPLLLIHAVAVLSLVLPIEEISGRISILFAVAFVEIGLRLSLDSRLPKVAYSILMQKMVNHLFYALLLLAARAPDDSAPDDSVPDDSDDSTAAKDLSTVADDLSTAAKKATTAAVGAANAAAANAATANAKIAAATKITAKIAAAVAKIATAAAAAATDP